MVPSSTMLMPLRHILCPSLPENIDCPLRMKSASNACPIASCSSIPEAPAPMTTGIFPPLGLLASNCASIPATALAARSSSRASSIISAPHLRLRDTLFVQLCPPEVKMACRDMLPIGRVSETSSPSELYIRISLVQYESTAITLQVRASRRRISESSFRRKGTNCAALHSLQSSREG